MEQITARSQDGLRVAINIRNHTVYTDEPEDTGGADSAPTPMELYMGTLAACIVVTTELYARRKQWPLTAVNVAIKFERVKKEDYPAYTGDAPYVNEIREQVSFEGPLTDEQYARLMEIATRCPVRKTMEYPTYFVEEEAATVID